jgi:hypothetical protein
LWCSHIGDHSQEELAKFGYRSERKAKTSFQILLQFGYLLEPIVWNMTISENKIHEIWGLSVEFFSPTKFLCMSCTLGLHTGLFFFTKVSKICPKKRRQHCSCSNVVVKQSAVTQMDLFLESAFVCSLHVLPLCVHTQ